MKFSKDDFVIGHLDFIVKKFNVPVKRIVDNEVFYSYTKKISSPQINTQIHRINLSLINQFSGKLPIVYIDSYQLSKEVHYPHFITILDRIETKYKIFDTWEGKEKWISSRTLSQAISSLRNHLKFCPQILLVG